MKWLHKKWAKNFFFSIFIFLFIIIFLIVGLTVYVNKVLTREEIRKIVKKYSNLYLDRNLSFKNYKFNFFKGIVLEDIHIERNNNISESIDMFIKELNLQYNYKQLFKLKLYIDKIVINNIILEINKSTVENELNYYKDKDLL